MKSVIAKARSQLCNAVRPIFLFDDDVDGFTSFLLLWRYVKCGKGIVLKTKPVVDEQFLRSVHDYDADLVVVLDKSGISEQFIEKCPVDILWVDHHEPQDVRSPKVTYVNPLNHNLSPYPTCYWTYLIADSPKEDLWIAATGYISDWQIVPEIHPEVIEKLRDLVPADVDKPQELLFDSRIGELIKILIFNLKGKTSDVRKSINTMTRIASPDEILERLTPAGRFIYSRGQTLSASYDKLLADIMSKHKGSDDKILLYTYDDTTTSMTAYLSNEMLYRFPEKVIIVARRRGDEYKCSLRCSPPLNIRDIIAYVVTQIEGYGGGHEQAVGGCIKAHDFEKFVELIREEVQKKAL
jgi:hypothetical protein